VPFSASHLLASVKTALYTAFRRFHGLAAHNGGAWLRLFLVPLPAHFGMQDLVQPLPEAILVPQPEIIVDRSPRRQIAGQHSPGTTTLENAEDAIQNHSPAMFTRATRRGFSWQVWSDFQPLSIIQVGRVDERDPFGKGIY